MRRVTAHLIMTIDGVVGFEEVIDTIMKLRNDEVLADFFGRTQQEDAMLLGRVTYQQWADYWPSKGDDPFAAHINRVSKYVVSRSLDAAPWGPQGNAALLSGDLETDVRALKRRPGGNIGVHGSPSLVESLLHADLLDELRLEVYPVIAGGGARLFHEGRPKKLLRLDDSRVTNNGVAILTYGLGA